MFTAAFWKATAERAIRTFAQALAAVLTAGATDLISVDWKAALSTAGMAALLAVLTALATSGIGAKGGPGVMESPARRASAKGKAGAARS
ncbi:holin [Streptomyces sp. URMC 123]|uniref:holin n=1 Tax=Streptomyces sp. URMC 123 TaxID=3423403 RepID=UPI003F1C8A4B